MEYVKPLRMVTFKVEVADWDDRYKISEDKETLYCIETEELSDDKIGDKYNDEGPVYCGKIHLRSAEVKSAEAISVRFASKRNPYYDANNEICLNCRFYNYDFKDEIRKKRGFLYPEEPQTTSACMHDPQPIVRKCNSIGCTYFNNIHEDIIKS